MTGHDKIEVGGNAQGNFVVGDRNSLGPVSLSPGPGPDVAAKPAVPRLFVSYRIDDSVYAAGAIADRLARHFGFDNIFRDRDSLPLGEPYPTKIRRALERCDMVLSVMGPSWLEIRDSAGRRRLDDPADWVRMELRMAFERDIPVVPVLLDHTPLPDPDRLPADISRLSRCTWWQVRHQSFDSDVRGLVDSVTSHAAGPYQAPERR